jgi:hypothetical protein
MEVIITDKGLKCSFISSGFLIPKEEETKGVNL